jgi:hypothetical protein
VKRHNLAVYAADATAQAVPNVKPVIPETLSPAQQISRSFRFQSYFDDALLENALLDQRPNEVIVASTRKEEQIPGYAIGLHPSSQTPVALQFKIGGTFDSGHALVLKPGEVVRPLGLPRGIITAAFSGFAWGIPFGWLGGGLATLLVFQSPDADVSWSGNPEVIFHRQRMQVVAPGALPAAASFNWPTRFPWVRAMRGTGASAASQAGQPQIAVEPTRTIMRLRMTTLAAPADMRVLLQGSNDFDLDSAGAVITTPVGFIDVTWGSFAGSGGAGDLATQYPYQELTGLIPRLSADDGGIQLVDLAGTLAGEFVDVVRYGRL